MALFYDRDFNRSRTDYDSRYRTGGDSRYFGSQRGGFEGYGYDRGFTDRGFNGRDSNDRWRTANGDPFGDRAAGTPMRIMRGEFRGGGHGYDREFRPPQGRTGYGANPVGYDPYTEPAPGGGMWSRGGYDRGFRGRGRGYDAGWF